MCAQISTVSDRLMFSHAVRCTDTDHKVEISAGENLSRKTNKALCIHLPYYFEKMLIHTGCV